jgi:hypothetical protein
MPSAKTTSVKRCKIKYRRLRRYKYQSQEEYALEISISPESDVEVKDGWVRLTKEGQLIFRKGYAWNGPSGPAVDSKNFMRSSLVHDGLYQLISEDLLGAEHREYADDLMRVINLEDGMSRFRAWYTWRAVRIFGRPATRVQAPDIQCAP